MAVICVLRHNDEKPFSFIISRTQSAFESLVSTTQPWNAHVNHEEWAEDKTPNCQNVINMSNALHWHLTEAFRMKPQHDWSLVAGHKQEKLV